MTASNDGIEDAVKEYILAEFLPGTRPSELDRTTPLVTGGILDSLATVQLVGFLEDSFGIAVEPHEASVDHLDSLALIADLVRRKRAG